MSSPRHIAINALRNSIERWRKKHPNKTVGNFIEHMTTKCIELMGELQTLFPKRNIQELPLYAIELARVRIYSNESGLWFK